MNGFAPVRGGRCDHCGARPNVAVIDGRTRIVVPHRDGCPAKPAAKP